MRKLVVSVTLLACFTADGAAQAPPDGDPWAVRPADGIISRLSVLPDSTALIKSLGDAAELLLQWKPPADADTWKRRRPEVERAFRASLGLDPLPERTPLAARTVARRDLGDHLIENVIFESRPGFPVTANLYRPKQTASGKRPAILSPIGHYLGPGKTATDVQARAIALARMGFIVLTYDPIGQGERMTPGNIHHDAGYALLPLGQTIAGWMVWDSMRAIDYLLTLDDVDPRRIGITGNSGGGLNTLFTAALDERVQAVAVVGYTFEFRHWIKYAGTHCACTHLPGIFRAMEWFEIAGLIAPRPLLMLQGEEDAIFPVEGARRAARGTAAVYRAMAHPERVRFVEVRGQPHAYSRPFREPMYGWMAHHLLGQAADAPIPERTVEALPERDPRLLCDPEGTIARRSPTVVQLAREQAVRTLASLDPAAARQWVRSLTAPPDPEPHFLSPDRPRKTPAGAPEKISFVSEEGQYIPGLLWLPEGAARRSIIVVDGRGKRAVAESGLVPPLIARGFAVLAVDLRGRGEMLDRHRPLWDINYRLIASQVLSGRPLPGRRAFDLTRAVDYLSRRGLPLDNLAVAGIDEDALPALLAAVIDTRIRNVALGGWFHSFVSQMHARNPGELPATWNDPQLRGRIHTGEYEIDFGSVIPGVLRYADVPDLAALVAPRRVLFAEARDKAAFPRVPKTTSYQPARPLTAGLLLEWLHSEVNP